MNNQTKLILLFALMSARMAMGQTYNASPDLGNLKGNIKDKIKQPFNINGGFALNSVYTYNTGPNTNNPQPFTWIATANVNLQLLGYSMPFSFAYSNRKVQYNNPSFRFNRFALHPKYKNWTAHIGDISTAFSSYTLSGFQYTGGGLEYNKGKWQVNGLYGRFLKAIPEEGTIMPSYKRMGWGMKTVFKDKDARIGLSLFHAQDKINSIPQPVKAENAQMRPMEGTAFAVEAAYPLIKNLILEAEFSTSVLTRDLRLESDSNETNSSLFRKLINRPNGSTEIYHAFKAGFQYSFAQSSIGMNYERVDPGYQTLGGYFFTNDFENITAAVSQNLWKGKVTLHVNAGVQRDDLKRIRQSNMRRFIGTANIAIRPSQKMNIGLTYSNLQSYTFIRTGFEQINQVTPYQNLDTLDFTQLSNNGGINMNYALSQTQKQSQTLLFTGNYLETAGRKGDIIRKGDVTRFFNGAMNHSLSLTAPALTIATGLSYSYNYAATISGIIWGPMLNVSKAFLKKQLRTNYGIAWNTSNSLNRKVNVLNIRSGASATLAKQHNVNLGLVWQQKTGTNAAVVTYFTGTMGYSYHF